MKRYCTIAEYQRRTGLSYQTIKNAAETGQLIAIRTESGHWKIDTQSGINTEAAELVNRIDEQYKLLKSLCQHLGVAI